jgi:hypothetical protein
MSKKKHYRPHSSQGYMYNQSQQLNAMTYQFHFQNLYELALNRIKWLNLPRGCDSRFLEETLLLNGNAIIFQDPKINDLFYSTRVVFSGPLNVYDKPTHFRSVGNNGWNVDVPFEKGVVVFETASRYPTIGHICIFANRLTDLDRTRDVNLKNQKSPWIITGPEEKVQEMINFYKNVDSNEPAIFGLDGLKEINYQVLSMNAPFIGTELNYNKQLIMNEFMTFLGIDNNGMEKKERMTEEELQVRNSQVMAKRLNYLQPRREAADILNKRFGTNIQVVWNTDNQTDNYNYVNNVKQREGEE